jgi:hypothetical protein
MTGFHMSSLVSDARIDAVINEVYMQTLAAEPWSWLVTDATGTITQASPSASLSDCRQVLSVTLTDGSRSWVVDRSSRTSPDWLEPVETDPVRWALVQPDTVLFNPEPSKTYTYAIQFVTRGDELTSTDSPVFAAEYHVGLAYGAAALILVQENDETNRAQAYAGMYQDYLLRMRGDDNYSNLSAVQMGSKPRTRARRMLTWGG